MEHGLGASRRLVCLRIGLTRVCHGQARTSWCRVLRPIMLALWPPCIMDCSIYDIIQRIVCGLQHHTAHCSLTTASTEIAMHCKSGSQGTGWSQ